MACCMQEDGANKVLQPVQPQEQTTPDGIGPTQANELFVYNHEASHVIIYGHNMRNGSMFAGLLKYMQSGFYTSGENQYVYVYKGEDILRYTIFSVYESEAQSDTYTYNFSTVDAMRFYAEQMKEKSLYDTGVDISETTQVLTLSTCTADGERRIVVQAKLDTSP